MHTNANRPGETEAKRVQPNVKPTAATGAEDWVDEAIARLPPIVTAKEAMATLRTSQRNLYRLVAAGRIHAVRPAEAGSSRLLIPRSAIEKYLRSLEGDAGRRAA